MKKFLFVLAAAAAVTAPAWAGGMCPIGGMGASACPSGLASGSKIAHLLLALAAGYAVLTLSVRQTRKLSIAGAVIGWFIIAVSFSSLICTAAKSLCHRGQDRMSAPAGACSYLATDGGPLDDGEDKSVSPDKSPVTASPAKGAPEKKK